MKFQHQIWPIVLLLGFSVNAETNDVESYAYSHEEGVISLLPRNAGIAMDLRDYRTGELIDSLVISTKHNVFDHEIKDILGSNAEEVLIRVKTVSGTGISFEVLKIFKVSDRKFTEVGEFAVSELESMYSDHRKFVGEIEYTTKNSLMYTWSQTGEFEGKDLAKHGEDKYIFDGESFVQQK